MKNQLLFGVLLSASVVGAYTLTENPSFHDVFHTRQMPKIQRTTFPFDLSALDEYSSIAPIVVVGGGPSGATAALYGARAKYETYFITGPDWGGQLAQAGMVENLPGVKEQYGADVMEVAYDKAQRYGATFIDDEVVEVDLSSWPFKIVTKSSGTFHALTVIFATGAAPRKLGIPGEDEYWGKGVSACGICDGLRFKDEDVVVIGGGDTAVELATHVAPYARTVTVYVRANRMRATPCMQDRLKDLPNVHIVYNKQITEIVGDGENVTGINMIDTQTAAHEHADVAGVFVAIGHNPSTGLFKEYLPTTKEGYVILDSRSQESAIRGVFVAGDVCDGMFRQAAIACGQGCQAGLEAVTFLSDIGASQRFTGNLGARLYRKPA